MAKASNSDPGVPMSCELLLVGAGPIGLEMAAALKQRSVDYLHIEAGNIASTIAWYSPGTQIFSSPDRLAIAGCPFMLYPGVRALREDYLNYLRTVVEHHGLEIRRYRRLIGVDRTSEGFECRIARSAGGVGGPGEAARAGSPGPVAMTVRARRMILAIGNMHGPRLLGIPGEDAPWVSHYLGDIHDYSGCRVGIVGARNSAAEAAVRLARLGCSVVMCHRREDLDPARIKPWILPDLRTLAREGKVTLVPRVTPVAVEPGRLLVRGLDGTPGDVVVDADRVLLLTGYVQSPCLLEMCGVATGPDSTNPVHDPATMQTNVPGIFIAGTAAAGTQTSGTTHFIENCHDHVGRILTGLGLSHDLPRMSDRPPEEREA